MIKYLVDKKEFLKSGMVCTTATAPDNIEPKYADYSSDLNNNGKGNLTIEEYINLPENKNKNIEVVDTFEMEKLYNQYQKSLIEDFKEITEERWYEMLEVLPPVRWHNYKGINIFFISEAYLDSIHTCYIKAGDKCYAALQDIHDKDEVIYNNFIKSTENEI